MQAQSIDTDICFTDILNSMLHAVQSIDTHICFTDKSNRPLI